MANKHNEGINVSYVDGHVKWTRVNSLLWSQFTMATSGADLTTPVGPE